MNEIIKAKEEAKRIWLQNAGDYQYCRFIIEKNKSLSIEKENIVFWDRVLYELNKILKLVKPNEFEKLKA